MPRGGNAGRAAAATDGGSPQARATPPTEAPAGGLPGTLADIPVDLGALDHSGGAVDLGALDHARAAHLHQLQQLQYALAQAAQQQPGLFSGFGGAPAPPLYPPPPPASDLPAVMAALASIESRIAERLLPLEAGLNDLRTTVASPSSASAPAGDRGRVAFAAAPPRSRAASPAGSATDSEAVSRASTDDPSSLDALLGVASADLEHDLKQRGLSSAWAAAVKNTGPKMSADDIGNLSTLLTVGRMFQHLSYLICDMCDDPGAVSRDQLEAAIPHIDVARDALIARLNHYQLVASGLDAKSAAALAEAAAFKRRVARHGDGVLAGLPIACPHLAELVADFQKKATD